MSRGQLMKGSSKCFYSTLLSILLLSVLYMSKIILFYLRVELTSSKPYETDKSMC